MYYQLLAVAVALIVASAQAQAQVYRWVDENGVTIYSQTRPTTGDAVEIITATPPPSREEATPAKRLDDQIQESAEKNDQAESDELKKEYEAEQARIKKENCQSATYNLKMYQTIGNRIVKLPNGSYKRYTEEERQAKINESEEQIKKFCE